MICDAWPSRLETLNWAKYWSRMRTQSPRSGISAWLFGGWGLDARIGRITREHGDVEFWVERVDADRSVAPVPHPIGPAPGG